jgi:hypothetical protein
MILAPDLTSDVQHHWGSVDFAQPARVTLILNREYMHTQVVKFRYFFLKVNGLAGFDQCIDSAWSNPAPLELHLRGTPCSLDITKFLYQRFQADRAYALYVVESDPVR